MGDRQGPAVFAQQDDAGPVCLGETPDLLQGPTMPGAN